MGFSRRTAGTLRHMASAVLLVAAPAFAGVTLQQPPLPRPRSAKIVRRAIRAAAAGEEMSDTSMIENPESLRAITEAS